MFRHRTAARFARIFVCHLILTINPLGYTLYSTPIHCCCMYFHKAIFRTNSPEFHLFFLKKIFSYIDRVSPWCPSRATGWFLAGFFVVDEAI